jgi:hypothetical protein
MTLEGFWGSASDVGFSDHACEQFIKRAGLSDLSIDQARIELGDLARTGGHIERDHPAGRDERWRRSGLKAFPGYLLLDGWILCGIRPPTHDAWDEWTAITIVTLGDFTWTEALARGVTNRPCPTPRPVYARWTGPTPSYGGDPDFGTRSSPRYADADTHRDWPKYDDVMPSAPRPGGVDASSASAAGMLVILGLAILLGVTVGAAPDVLALGRPGGLVAGLAGAALSIILWGHIRLLNARIGLFAAGCALVAAVLASKMDTSPSEVRQAAALVAWITAFVPLTLASVGRYDAAVRAAVAVLAIEFAGVIAIAST